MAKIDPPPSNISDFDWSWREWIHRLFSDGVLDHDSRLDSSEARITANEANIASNTSRITTLENNTGDSVWTPLTLKPGFSNLGGSYATPAVRKLSSGLAVVKGVITFTTTISSGAVITTLPIGYRPLEDYKYPFSIRSGTIIVGQGYLTLSASTGNLSFDSASGPGPLILNIITFYAEQ